MKKIVKYTVLSLMISAALFFSSISANAVQVNDIYNRNVHTNMYYDANTKKIYMSSRMSWHGGSSYGSKSWYYSISDGRYIQQKRIAEKSDSGDFQQGYKDFQEISESEYENELREYESKFTKVDMDKGLTSFDTNRLMLSSFNPVVDYSFVHSIAMGVGDSQQLLSGLMIEDSDIDIRVEWTSSNAGVATVDNSGNVTATGNGECTISSTAEGIGTLKEYHIVVAKTAAMAQNQSAIHNIIRNGGSEKNMYDQIYNLDGIKAGGHVITDLNGDGTYEMITRSSDRKTIKIYKIVGDELVQGITLTGITQADLRYSMRYSTNYESVVTSCYFTTLEYLGNDSYKMKVFEFNDIYSKMTYIDTYDIVKEHPEYDGSTYTYVNGNSSRPKFVLQESFNDYCTEVVPTSAKYSDISELGFLLDEFINVKYYQSDDLVLPFSDGSHIRGVPATLLCDIASNEIYARHGARFSNPIYISFANKKSNYQEVNTQITIDSLNGSERETLETLEQLVPQR